MASTESGTHDESGGISLLAVKRFRHLINVRVDKSVIIIFINTSQTDAIYLDFRKAFDSVSHNELLYKLWHFGITGSLWMWFKGYLTSRHQFVKIGHSASGVLPVISGVPQGSILGPLLFLIYINDLPDRLLASKILLFADDAKCFMPISPTSDSLTLQSDLSSLVDWSTMWKLDFNENKCCVIRFTKNELNPTFSYSINNTAISSVGTQKDLGVVLSSDMQWRSHYLLITSRAYKTLGLICRVFPQVSDIFYAKRRLYFSLVRSHLLYCSPLWHPHLLVDIKSLETVQRRATKPIVNNPNMDYRARLIHINMLPLMMEYEIADIMFFIKSLSNVTDRFNIDNFISFSTSRTRSSSYLKLRHTVSKSNVRGHFYFRRIPRLWNSLPLLDTSLSVPTIRAKLRQYFWNYLSNAF